MTTKDEINLLFQQAVIANSNKKPLKIKKLFFMASVVLNIFLFIFLIFALFYEKPTHKEYKTSFQNTSNQFDTHLSKEEKNTFKKMVKQLALQEQRHINSIHAELRHRFNYRSYHHLNQKTFFKIKNYLTLRLEK